jgi:hypothetical protein
MPFEKLFPSSTCSGMESETRAEWPQQTNDVLQPELVPPTLLGMLELRAGLEDDLIKIRSLVAAMQARRPLDLPAILGSLRYADRLVAKLPVPNAPVPETISRFDKQRLVKWMSEFSIAGQDAICSSVTLIRNVRAAELGLLLILERYEQQTRAAIHVLDEHLLESEPQSLEEACGLLTFIGGLLAADTTIDYPFFASLVVECARVIETNIGISAKASGVTQESTLAY